MTDNLQTIRSKKPEELRKMLEKERTNLAKFSREKQLGQIKNVHDGISIRKNIARILTVLNEENKNA